MNSNILLGLVLAWLGGFFAGAAVVVYIVYRIMKKKAKEATRTINEALKDFFPDANIIEAEDEKKI